MRLRIDEALAAYTLKTGERLSRADLARLVLPEASVTTRHIVMKKLADGETKRPDPELITKIARLLKVDINFLFGWRENDEH